jgi:uncharacterized protein (TIGR02145 family)
MKKKNKILIHPLFIIGLTLVLINSCEKDKTESKKNPVIIWENPADITYGTLLSDIQLNATANVPGTFTYTLAIGTKLNEGANQDLKVDFTPTDLVNYNSISINVKINVIASIIGTNIDADGNVYHTITIGTQTWMVENLKTTKYNDGTTIPNITDGTAWSTLTTPAYCWYNNDFVNKDTYGALYNWYTIKTGKLCPAGWHVPTNAEWDTLLTYLGGESIAGDKLKETGTIHWTSPNTAANNSSGFTALPAGCRTYTGLFKDIGGVSNWWSSAEIDTERAWFRSIHYYGSYVDFNVNYKNFSFSIRCVKD